jgi:hypothetical protein
MFRRMNGWLGRTSRTRTRRRPRPRFGSAVALPPIHNLRTSTLTPRQHHEVLEDEDDDEYEDDWGVTALPRIPTQNTLWHSRSRFLAPNCLATPHRWESLLARLHGREHRTALAENIHVLGKT